MVPKYKMTPEMTTITMITILGVMSIGTMSLRKISQRAAQRIAGIVGTAIISVKT